MTAPSSIIIGSGYEYTATAYRQTAGVATPIPTGFEATMIFTPTFDIAVAPWTLTSDPPAGLTIDYAGGSIAIYIGATFTATLPAGLRFCWTLSIYDPLNPDSVIFLGGGSGNVSGKRLLMSDDVLVLQSENSVLLLPVIDPQVLLLVGNGGSGPAGPPGPPGGAAFVYTQVSPSGSWVINHNLGSLVHVTLLNTAGTIVDADVVETSINTVTISFNTPQAGTAVISP